MLKHRTENDNLKDTERHKILDIVRYQAASMAVANLVPFFVFSILGAVCTNCQGAGAASLALSPGLNLSGGDKWKHMNRQMQN